jgi:predicted glycosyltransferase
MPRTAADHSQSRRIATSGLSGSGGTMTAESALLGVPTISYNAVPNIVEKYLVKNNLVKRETNPKKIIKIIRKLLESSDNNSKKRARKISNGMEDPIQKLIQIIRVIMN